MGKLPVLLVLVGACALWSCGGDDEGDGSDDGGAAGEAGSGGAGGNNGGRGGAGGTGTGASAGAGSGGLGAAGTGGEGEGGTPEPGCETRSAGDTFGELDGQAIDEFWSVDSLGRAEGDPWFWIDEIDGRGYDFFRSSGEGNPTQLGSEVHDLSIGILWAPSSSDVAGEVICFGAGTAERTQTGVVEFKTEHAELLGACPGEPVDGEVTLCNGPCTNPVENELEGEPLSTPGMTLSGSGEEPDTIIQGRADNLFVISYVSGELASEATGDVEQALLVTYEGDVYCAGSDSTYEWAGVNGTQLTLRNLSKLGTCTPDGGSGSLLACR